MKIYLKTLIISIIFYSCQNSISNDIRIINIGRELIEFDFSKNDSIEIDEIVSIGTGLKEKIQMIQNKSTKIEYLVERGDLEKAFGDKKADVILSIITDYEELRIRFKYDKNLDKYHILGWMTSELEITDNKN